MKKLLKNIIRKIGYDVTIKKNKKINSFEDKNQILTIIVNLIFDQKIRGERRFSIVQVGANDGVTVDPVHRFAMSNNTSTELLLIEPQPDIFALLKNNYKDHKNVSFANIAIGNNNTLKLYPDQFNRKVFINTKDCANNLYDCFSSIHHPNAMH